MEEGRRGGILKWKLEDKKGVFRYSDFWKEKKTRERVATKLKNKKRERDREG